MKELYNAQPFPIDKKTEWIVLDVQNLFNMMKCHSYYIKKSLVYAKMYNEKELILSALGLKAIPDEVFEMKQLETLFLSNKSYYHFEEHLKTKIITDFDIGNNTNKNRMTTILPQIGQLKSLKVLCLGGLGLEYLPNEIGELENLEILDISRNPIEKLPKSILKLKNLKEIIITFSDCTNKLHEHKERTKEPFPYSIRKKLEILTV